MAEYYAAVALEQAQRLWEKTAAEGLALKNEGSRQIGDTIGLAKFICAILVVIFHVCAPRNGKVSSNYFEFGFWFCLMRLMIPFFFMSSAFFLYGKTAIDQFDLQFTKRHLTKLIRLYITWSIIYFPLSLGEAIGEGKGFLHTSFKMLRDFLFYGSFSHLWYLHAAIVSVALISGLLYLHVHPKKIVIIAFAFYCAGLFAQSWFGFIRPLEGTLVWDLLKLIERVIVSTRDGLFFGFLFTGIGMLFAVYKIPITEKQARAGFLFSLLLMLTEALTLKRFDFLRESDVYLFLVPTAFFLFACIQYIELPDHIYKTLRVLSAIIYFLHLWVYYVVRKALRMVSGPLGGTWMVLAITLIVTLAGAAAILKLSDKPKLKWLKKLYS